MGKGVIIWKDAYLLLILKGKKRRRENRRRIKHQDRKTLRVYVFIKDGSTPAGLA